MDVSDLTKTFLNIFYIVGISGFNPHSTTTPLKTKTFTQKLKHIRFRTIALFVIIPSMAVSYLLLLNSTQNELTRKNMIFGHFFIIILCVFGMIAIVQNNIFVGSLQNMTDKFKYLEKMQLKCFQNRLNYKSFVSRYRINVIACCTSITLAMFVMLGILLSSGRNLVALHLYLLDIFAVTTDMHALFYINLQRFFVQVLVKNMKLARTVKNLDMLSVSGFGSRGETTLIAHIYYCKGIHFELWKISKTIEKHFGWNLVIFFLKSFTTFAYCSFWLYRTLDSEVQFWIFGKYVNLCYFYFIQAAVCLSKVYFQTAYPSSATNRSQVTSGAT